MGGRSDRERVSGVANAVVAELRAETQVLHGVLAGVGVDSGRIEDASPGATSNGGGEAAATGGSNRYWKRNLMARDRDGGADICVADHNHMSAAQWQLLQTLRLYEEGEDYYSVITLAGAAEEIFGTLSRKMRLGCALDRLKATLPMLSERFLQQELGTREAAKSVNRAKNWLKHDGENQLGFDARFEAEDMLERAIQNCLPIVTSIVNESSEELITSNLVDSISRYDERRFADRSAGTET